MVSPSSLRALPGLSASVLLSWHLLPSDCLDFDALSPVFFHNFSFYLSWLFSHCTWLAPSLSLLVGLTLPDDSREPGFKNPMVISLRPIFKFRRSNFTLFTLSLSTFAGR